MWKCSRMICRQFTNVDENEFCIRFLHYYYTIYLQNIITSESIQTAILLLFKIRNNINKTFDEVIFCCNNLYFTHSWRLLLLAYICRSYPRLLFLSLIKDITWHNCKFQKCKFFFHKKWLAYWYERQNI